MIIYYLIYPLTDQYFGIIGYCLESEIAVKIVLQLYKLINTHILL